MDVDFLFPSIPIFVYLVPAEGYHPSLFSSSLGTVAEAHSRQSPSAWRVVVARQQMAEYGKRLVQITWGYSGGAS